MIIGPNRKRYCVEDNGVSSQTTGGKADLRVNFSGTTKDEQKFQTTVDVDPRVILGRDEAVRSGLRKMWKKVKKALGEDYVSEQSDSQAADLPKDIQLRVADARQRDVGHSKVRINNEAMQKLAITPGGFVEVHGKKRTVAVAWQAYAEDQGEEIVRMDGLIEETRA